MAKMTQIHGHRKHEVHEGQAAYAISQPVRDVNLTPNGSVFTWQLCKTDAIRGQASRLKGHKHSQGNITHKAALISGTVVNRFSSVRCND